MRFRYKNLTILCTIILTALVLIIVVTKIVRENNMKQLDIGDCITVDFTGLNGYGTAHFTVDKDKVYKELAGDEKNTVVLEKYMSISESIVVTTEKERTLSNGDICKYYITYDSDAAKSVKCRLNGLAGNVVVHDLGEGQKIDLFEKIQLMVSGISPECYATIANQWEGYLANLSFSISKQSHISEGETITVTCDASDEELMANGYIVDNRSKEYKIGSLSSYVSDIQQIDMTQIKALVEENKDIIVRETEDLTFRMLYKATEDSSLLFQYNTETVNSVEYVKTTFLNKKEGSNSTTRNYLYVYYKANITNGTMTKDVYFAFEYSDMMCDSSGRFMINKTSPETRYVCATVYDDVYFRTSLGKEGSYEITELTVK